MCGIFATIKDKEAPPCTWAQQQALEQLHHRGPNKEGWVHIPKLGGYSITLGMTRLKIVDQSDLTVPLEFKHLGIVIAFNGEIYNWKELRRSLPGPWQTECDIEVLAAAWRLQGPSCLHHMNGMWSFILVDKLLKEVYLCRDRAGQKPLFYADMGDRLYVASEAKALPVQLQEQPCADKALLEYDILHDTPLKGVHRVEPGTWLKLKSGKDPVLKEWWSPPPPIEEATVPLSTAVEELLALLEDAVLLRARVQTSAAILQSGGLDSSIIAAICDKHDLELPGYCMTFDEIDNLTMAQVSAQSPERITAVKLTKQELPAILHEVAYFLDTPATWSALCLYALCKQIHTDGHNVVLSGEGADELFCGYSRHRILHWVQRCIDDPRLQDYLPLILHTLNVNSLDELLLRQLARGTSNSALSSGQRLLGRYALPRPLLSDKPYPLPIRMARLEFHTTMQVLLRMGDRMAAAWSIENRCPFLDYRVISFAARLPAEFKIDRDWSKKILRLVATQLKIDPRIVNETSKKGLAIPWAAWSSGSTGGSRGRWDRSAFSKLMDDAWRKTLRSTSCTTCPEPCPESEAEPDPGTDSTPTP